MKNVLGFLILWLVGVSLVASSVVLPVPSQGVGRAEATPVENFSAKQMTIDLTLLRVENANPCEGQMVFFATYPAKCLTKDGQLATVERPSPVVMREP